MMKTSVSKAVAFLTSKQWIGRSHLRGTMVRVIDVNIELKRISLFSTRNSAASCLKPRLGGRGESDSRNCLKLSRT